MPGIGAVAAAVRDPSSGELRGLCLSFVSFQVDAARVAASVSYTHLDVYKRQFRGTSALVQLFWFYFVLPLFGVQLPAMLVGIVVLALNAGAYGAEVVRGAIRAVPPGQREAGVALNLTRGQIMRRIVVPQAIPAMLPPAGNLLIELLKNTALVSLITITDLTFRGQLLRSETLRTTEILSLIHIC